MLHHYTVLIDMGARRGEQGGAVAPPWKIKKKSLKEKKCTNKILTCKRPLSYVMRGNFLTIKGPHVMR